MRPPGILLAVYCIALAPLICQCLDLRELNVSLQQYSDAAGFAQLAANYHNHLEWIKTRFGPHDNNRYVFMLAAVSQLEISARNYAIRSLLADKLGQLFVELYAKTLILYQNEPALRDAAIELCLARAKLRSKITMLRDNRRHWSALYDLMMSYAPTDVAYTQLMSQLEATIPRDSLDVKAELEDQSSRKIAYFELKEKLPAEVAASKWSSERVYNILDRTIDRWLECGAACNQLRVPAWTNAGPLGPNFKLAQWQATYVGQNILQTIVEARREIEQHMRVTNLFDLALNKPEVIESYQRKILDRLDNGKQRL